MGVQSKLGAYIVHFNPFDTNLKLHTWEIKSTKTIIIFTESAHCTGPIQS